MPNPEQVNSQVTDAITQSNVKVIAEAPAMALANLYQATGQALGNAAHWANTAQQNATLTSQATTLMGVTTASSIDTASTAAGMVSIADAVS